MIKSLLNRMKIKIFCRSNEGKIKYLCSKGAKIGAGTRFNCGIEAFGTEPFLITIGENCLIAGEVHFITHDGGVKVLNTLNYFDGIRMDSMKPVVIGNNTYIGYGAFIMPGVTIGDNCIIGAGAIVTKDIPSNMVAVGIPAQAKKTVDEYYKTGKNKKCFHPTAGMSFIQKKEYYEKIYSK